MGDESSGYLVLVQWLMCLKDTLRIAAGRKLAVMVTKDIEAFPENSDRLTGTIDIWWIVRILVFLMHLWLQEMLK